MSNDEQRGVELLMGELRSACLMIVRRAPRSLSRHELGCNTITAALHISDGLDDYQPNMIKDLNVRKAGKCA